MKMKLFLPVFILLFFAGTAKAQISNPVTWSYTAKKIGDRTYELHLTATINAGWHVYAQDAGEGPVPTKFAFNTNPLVTLNGSVKEIGTLETSFDPNFNSTLRYYEKKVDFVQVVKLRAAVTTVVKGTLTYMVCSDKLCLPPKDIPFSINISGK